MNLTLTSLQTATLLVIAAALGLFVLAGCARGGGPAPPPADLNATDTPGCGTIVTDVQGHALYRFDADTAQPSVSHCYDQCAALWPPLLAAGATVTIQGLDRTLISTTTRRDGTQQVTLGGWPLYRSLEDTVPGEVAGQGSGGSWFAVTPAGARATARPPSSSDTP